MNILHRLTSLFRNRTAHTESTPSTSSLDVLELGLRKCQQVLDQAQEDLNRVIEEQAKRQQWLESNQKQIGQREAQIKHALQHGKLDIAKELAEDLVDLEALFELEASAIASLASRAAILQQDIEEGLQAIAIHQAKLEELKEHTNVSSEQNKTLADTSIIDPQDVKESLNFLKRVHHSLRLDLQDTPQKRNEYTSDEYNLHGGIAAKKSRNFHTEAILTRNRRILEVER